MGNNVRSSGQDRVTDNLEEGEEKTDISISLMLRFSVTYLLCIMLRSQTI